MSDIEFNKINLNNFVNTDQTSVNNQNNEDQPINLLSSFIFSLAPTPNVDPNNPNLIQNISDVKREIVEDTIKELDSVRYSSFAASPCPSCTQEACIKPCSDGNCNCAESPCCWNNKPCWAHYCKPNSLNNNEENCCANSAGDGDCHATSPNACCKCKQFCIGTNQQTFYPASEKKTNWPAVGKVRCYKPLSDGIHSKLFPADTGCAEGYSDAGETYGAVYDTLYIEAITCNSIFSDSSALYDDAADYGCDNLENCEDITDKDLKRLCYSRINKPINLQPGSDSYFCVSNSCGSLCGSLGNYKPCGLGSIGDDLGCSCQTTIAYMDANNEPVYCSDLKSKETDDYPHCKFWKDWGFGCAKPCPNDCIVDPFSSDYCTKYFQCVNKLGNYAPGGICNTDETGCSCGKSPCVGSDGNTRVECYSQTKSQYENCLISCPCSGCCTNTCQIFGCDVGDYWNCVDEVLCDVPFECCVKDCLADCGSDPCNSPNPNCRKGFSDTSVPGGGCCACADPQCASDTITEYQNCLTHTECTTNGCCTNPCLTTGGKEAQSEIKTVADYDACLAKTGKFSTVTDSTCCGTFKCEYCGTQPNICLNTDVRCKNPSSPGTDCCVCNDSVCATSTKAQYDNCINALNSATQICRDSNCCTNPCTRTPPTSITSYKQCIAGQGIYAGYDPACCGSFNCTWCGANPVAVCANSEPLCSSNGCCVCNIPACATTTKAQYENCIKSIAQGGCPTPACCVNPCASIPVPTDGVSYNQCITRTGAYSGFGSFDTACCGNWNCSWCGSDPVTVCANTTFSQCPSCCTCDDNPVCQPSDTSIGFTKSEWLNCIASCPNINCCETDPCLGAPTDYWECIDTSNVNDDGIPWITLGCCNFNCSACTQPTDRDGDGVPDSSYCDCARTFPPQCTLPTICSTSDCCVCSTSECATTTKAQYDNCVVNCPQSSCCDNPCNISGVPVLSLITTPQLYDQCIAKTGIFSGLRDNACCGSFLCSYCGSTPCTSTDTRCKNISAPETDCCPCNDSACASTTVTQYQNCLTNTTCLSSGCCSDPCSGMPIIDTIEKWRACKAAESGTNNEFKQYTDKGCSCGVFTCALCGTNSCSNADSLCQDQSCCVCNRSQCLTDTKSRYDICRTTPSCVNAGCCTNPCIGKPKDYNECLRSEYAVKGCCDAPPPGPCDLCNHCRDNGGICDTEQEYQLCIESSYCATNKCCIRRETEPCSGCPNTCAECKANAQCVQDGCCSHFNCTNMNCPDSSTINGWKACKQNQCCNEAGCCVYPCTNCSKDFTTCMQDSFCKNAGCCIAEPPSCAGCDYENPQDCYSNLTCASNGCCPIDPCEGCLDADPNSYYTCILNPGCNLNGCCGLAPCILNNCRSSTKAEYEACLANPDCVPPQQSPDHPCCTNPCLGCSTNYFECNKNSACVAAGCCPTTPTCLDCKNDPDHPNASCTHPDPRCSNSPDAGVPGCCSCKSSRCQDDTRNQYITCINKQNKNFCIDTWGTGQPCCTNPCSNCPPYKESAYPTCITTSGCADKGCCNAPPPDPCFGCRNANCSDIAECVKNVCCRETPPCETCPGDYATCIQNATCVTKGCCPPNPCTPCNKSRTKEGYAECSADPVCVQNNCCNNPCDLCNNYYYKECQTDVYCVENECCPPEPCTTCSDNYEECISNDVCRVYCCCKQAT